MPGVREAEPKPPFESFDALRLVALSLVTLQHAQVLNGHEPLQLAGVRIGPLGVAIFLAISGYCGARSRKPPATWLVARLTRLYPAYWLVMVAAFALTAVAGRKSFTLGQFASQMLGFGALTHSQNLVNQSMWFITALLIGYLSLAVLRILRVPAWGSAFAAAGLAVACCTLPNFWLWQRLLPFFLAAAIGACVSTRRAPVLFVVAGLLVLLTSVWQSAFTGAGLALAAMALGIAWPRRSSGLRILAGYSYEYFLVHGICLAGMMQLLPGRPVAAVGLGLVLSAISAVLLQRLVKALMPGVSRSNRMMQTKSNHSSTHWLPAREPISR